MPVDRSQRKKILKPEEAENIRKAIKETEKPEKVDYWRTLFDLALKHGLRPGEAVSRKVHHIDFQLEEIIIDSAKNYKNRTIGTPDSFLVDLRHFTQGKEGGEWLFPSDRTSRHITVRSFEIHCRKWAVNAGIYEGEFVGVTEDNVTEKVPEKRRVTPHTLRHTFATQHLRDGTPLEKLSHMMGHSSVDVTNDEYGHLTSADHKKYQNNVNL